jgi:hypothetical protein
VIQRSKSEIQKIALNPSTNGSDNPQPFSSGPLLDFGFPIAGKSGKSDRKYFSHVFCLPERNPKSKSKIQNVT